MRVPEREERKGGKDIFEATVTENFPQVNIGHQTTDPENP